MILLNVLNVTLISGTMYYSIVSINRSSRIWYCTTVPINVSLVSSVNKYISCTDSILSTLEWSLAATACLCPPDSRPHQFIRCRREQGYQWLPHGWGRQQGPSFPRTSQDGLLGNLPSCANEEEEDGNNDGNHQDNKMCQALYEERRRDMQSVPRNDQRLYDDEGYKNPLSVISLNRCPTVPTVHWVKSLSIEATARPVTVLPPVLDKCLLFLSSLSLELSALQSMRPCFTPSSPRAVSKAAFGLAWHHQ